MENLIHNRIESLLPYLRGFRYDEILLLPRISVLFPHEWDITYFTNNKLVIESATLNENSKGLIIGSIREDLTIDFLFDEIEKVIIANQEKEKKKLLLEEKYEELQNFINNASLEEIKNLKIIDDDKKIDILISQKPSIVEDIVIKRGRPSKKIIKEEVEIKPILIDVNADLIDDEISYNPNLDLPPMPGIINEMENYNG